MIPESLQNRPFLPVATEHLTLRPVQKSDAEDMTRLANDIRIAERLARLPHPYTLADALEFIEDCHRGFDQGKFVRLAIIRRKDQKFLGMIGLEDELGYWLGVDYWGKGYGKEAMKAFVYFCFFVLNHEKLITCTLEDNVASRKIFERLGFSKTEIKQRASPFYEGQKNLIYYELTRERFLDNYRSHERPLVWVVGAALVNEQGQMLIAERPEGKSLPGVWELPGGKMEVGETPEHALIRELKEELDIDVKEDDLEPFIFISYRYDTFHMIMPIYICQNWDGEPHGAEGQKVMWARYEDLAQYPLPSADIIMAHRLADILKSRGIWK